MNPKKLDISVNYLPVDINEEVVSKAMEDAAKKKSWVIAIFIGTKPCFYKLYGSIVEAEQQGLPHIIINSDQHYDKDLTFGLKEFQYDKKVGFNLNIRGGLVQKSMELFGKVEAIGKYLKERWPNVKVVPVVNGDTIMCGIVPAAWMFTRDEKAIHNEAGLRSMAPTVISEAEEISPEEFVDKQFNGEWKLLMSEPFPEQWDSYVGSKGSEYFFAPLEINKQHLVREGYPESNIFVTGGVVVEAFEKKMNEKPTKSIFEVYPELNKGKWIRFDIHRKENQSEGRIKAIIDCMRRLVERGHNLCFIEMN
ncbi:MAG: UDP-N-acetylglucosamine 2-epimerase, partial [Nanoarchaeota archaeon]|nr:UDP-N-acetylglucosamine 2-epimerase [Nanoarchaeota archaeon]